MARFLCGIVVVGAASLLFASSTQAQVDTETEGAKTPYSGVTPQGGDPPTMPAPPPGFNYVTWPGFRTFSDGSSSVFLQLTGPVTYKTVKRGRRILITMEKVKVPLRNNFRRVITRHFKDTPVSKFRLRKLKKDRIRLEVSLRRGSKHTISMKSAGRYQFLVVTFPPPFSRSR